MNLQMGPLDYYLPTRIIFGWGQVARLPDLAKGLTNSRRSERDFVVAVGLGTLHPAKTITTISAGVH